MRKRRLILDAAPDYVVPAAVSFVASDLQAAVKAVETKDNLAKLMLRVDLKIDPKVVETYYGKVGTGLRGEGLVRTRPDAKWPAELQVKLPPAPVAQEAAPASAPIGGASAPAPAPAPALAPPTEAAAPAPAAQETAHAGAPPSTPALAHVAVAAVPTPRETKPVPPALPFPAPPSVSTPAHAPTVQASTSARLAQEPTAEVAPESLAQLRGAWAPSAGYCDKLFQLRGSAWAYRQPVDQFAQAAIIESQRIRLPTGVCRLERASHEGGALEVSGECQDFDQLHVTNCTH